MQHPLASLVGSFLVHKRSINNFSQRACAISVCIDPQYLNKIELEKRNCSPKMMCLFAKAFNMHSVDFHIEFGKWLEENREKYIELCNQIEAELQNKNKHHK